MKVLLFLLMILPFGWCVNSVASAGHILKGNAEDDAKNFLNINDRTSALRFTDGDIIRKDIGRAKMLNRRTDTKKTWNAISMRE